MSFEEEALLAALVLLARVVLVRTSFVSFSFLIFGAFTGAFAGVFALVTALDFEALEGVAVLEPFLEPLTTLSTLAIVLLVLTSLLEPEDEALLPLVVRGSLFMIICKEWLPNKDGIFLAC